jgi:hypothetical protein
MRITRNGVTTAVELVSDKGQLGMFDIGYNLIDNPDEELVQEIIDWLAVNCIDNFIVTRLLGSILAGGYHDNAQAFRNGFFKIKKRRARDREWSDYRIKLSAHDNAMFSMVWIDHSS